MGEAGRHGVAMGHVEAWLQVALSGLLGSGSVLSCGGLLILLVVKKAQQPRQTVPSAAAVTMPKAG